MIWVDPDAFTVTRRETSGFNQQIISSDWAAEFVAIDPVVQQVYWVAGVSGGRGLFRANYDGSNVQHLPVDQQALYRGIAIDTVEGKIYILDIDCTPQNVCNGVIRRTGLAGIGLETVLALEVNSIPHDIVIDPVDRKMYWSEFVSWRIRRANLDGSQVEFLTDVNDYSSLALDANAGKIYWSAFDQFGSSLIWEANLDMTGREAAIANLPSSVRGLAVEPPETDLNQNGIVDDCEAAIPPAPLSEFNGVSKVRFISFSVTDGRQTALRVRLASLHHVTPPYTGGPSVPFTASEGLTRWVGSPTPYRESSTSFEIRYHASQLQCSPHYMDWSSISLLHVTGSAITPSSMYEVENVPSGCMGIESTCATVSAPVQLTTARWGDVQSLQNPPSPTVQPDITDVSAIVDKFRNTPDALTKSRVLLSGFPGNPYGEISPSQMGLDIDFSHISACVDAYRGAPYPYTISSCP